VNIEAGRQQPSLHVLLDMSMALNFDILSYIKSEFWQTSADKKKKVGLEEALSKLKVAIGTKSTISAFITKHSG
jgi:DNA polymerase II large subunit